MNTTIIILFILIVNIAMGQNDSIMRGIIEEERQNDEVIEFINISNNKNCDNLNIIDFDIIHCDSIKDKEILPHRSHRMHIRSRIIDFENSNDTIEFSLIGLSDCCPKFEIYYECIDDSTINLNYKNISSTYCFCGLCPFIFNGKLSSKNMKINNILLNNKIIEQRTDRYNDNVVRFIEEDTEGRKTVRTYIDNGYRVFNERDLLLEEKFDKDNIKISTRIYFNGIEIND